MASSKTPLFSLLPLIVLLIPLFYSVSILNQSWMMQEPERTRPKKPDHLVFGPVAGRGLPNRLQCEGLIAKNKIDKPRENHSTGDGISFVTVFTIYKSAPTKLDEKSSDMVTVGNVSYNKVDLSMAILNTYINFIQVSMPRSNIIILTDPDSDFSLNRRNTDILPIKGDYSRGNLMLQRIKSYIAFLDKKIVDRENLGNWNHCIFTDSDIAVVDDFGEIFQNYPDFHIAFTFRNNKNQPLNSGFIAVRGTVDGINKAKSFLEQVLDAYKTQYMGASRMLGDQLALYWVINLHLPFASQKFSRHEIFTGEVNGANLLFLPCEIYNWTPPEGAGQFHGMPLDVKIVHFKGSRKRLMLESWNYYNSTYNLSDMLCLILSSGRTKYDF